MKAYFKIKALLFASLMLLILGVLLFWSTQRKRIQAKVTVTRMRETIILLQNHPGPCDSECLRGLAEAHGKSGSLKDAWGSDLLIHMTTGPSSPPSYEVRSLGRDGLKGGCCTRWVDDLDEDAVIRDDTWLQLWLY